MIDLRMIDELTRKLGEALPPGVTQAKDQLDRALDSLHKLASSKRGGATNDG